MMADYGCFPLWLRRPASSENTDPTSLPISTGLVDGLMAWAQRYDATLDEDDPTASGFPDARSELEFREEGLRLARQLAAELGPRYLVEYYDEGSGAPHPVTSVG
ncbi:hypothetical protein ACFFWC_13615 [Plantactinospora siamensis]|uniref:Uncharacterized protein n=1 Tax=Plantactinospora siamensis TaxID=555372 RepID=A0ABV6P2D4_9ACTN